ncbi:interferon-induced very large GTPase 1-like [Megalops cyprinoides]|uniref:interferon-induced very large GTPase 1-like n=1 Tax=Megalops cyprinoides TaxID=118141 RepID=UPI001863B101|nr:interferon-induced very large GTPase 1-like [Megalops cyprinoides]
MESLRKSQEQVQQGLNELENLYKEGKDRNDAVVKGFEEKVRVALDVPKESWAPPGQSLKDLIQHLHGQLEILQSASLSPETISDVQVLKNASGGLALEGFYRTQNLEDLLAKREQLIEVPLSFSLIGPKQSAMYEQKEFSSHRSQTVHQKVMEKLGFSFSSSLNVGLWGFGIRNTTERNESSETEETRTQSCEQSSIFSTKYNYIPLASCFIEKDKLKLSQGAIKALQEIETILSHSGENMALRNRVSSFYERFGSHANQGPIHFGGVFWWTASAEGFRSDELSEMKKLTSKALNIHVGAGYTTPIVSVSAGLSISSSEVKGSSTGRHSETLMSKVQLSVSKTGGPAETDNHLQWKSHLVTSNRTWSVVDRGTTLIPVWEIIMSAHKNDFQDALSLGTKLKNVYEDITKLNEDELWGEDVLMEIERAKALIQSVQNWTASDCESQLTELLEFKTRLYETTGSYNIWIQTCLSSPELQDYLMEVVRENNHSTAGYLRILMRCLLDPGLYTVKNFRHRAEIMKWVYLSEEDTYKDISVSEFSELANILQHAKEELEDRYAFRSAELGHSSKMDDKNAESNKTDVELDSLLAKHVPSLSEIQHTNEQNIPVDESKGEKTGSFMNLLQKLGLSKCYPQKMTKADVLVIDRLSLNVNQPKEEKELNSHYLYKLMMLDYRARYLFIKPEATIMAAENDEATVDENDDFFTFDETSIPEVSSKQAHIHPMDVHMAIFHCANDFLRQYLFSKLSTCQFALPFLVPSPCTGEVEFPLWALRHISKSWQSKKHGTSDSSGKCNIKQMFNTPVPIVSFIRLGASSNSKAQILNGVISKQRHHVFYHRHCKGSTPDSLLMNGVVEIAWYCPGGKEDDIFDDCVAFLNLHGDAAEQPKQLEFLQAVSTVIVLLLSEHPLGDGAKVISQKLSKSPVPLICLFSGQEKVQPSKNLTKVRLAAKKRNEAELTDELISSIKQCIGAYEKTGSLETCSEVARKQQFRVDEDKQSCQDGCEQAQTLRCLLSEGHLPTLKERLLPLQGELWHAWCRKNKEQYRLQCKAQTSIEQQLSTISAEMDKIRQRQLNTATPLNDFLRSFLDCLTSPVHSHDTTLYMLQWLRILLDDLTAGVIAGLEGEYHSTWTQMRRIPKDKAKSVDTEKLRTKLNDISDKMAASTIGLQHLMREVGQLYEAIAAPKNVTQNDNNLPAIGVEMLVSGYPLELMDGDAAHVPLDWIKAVLDELIRKVGDKKVFVLSILGIQSSGKSTMLNTMFGLQFTVSAGRCTRGAFMQLLKVDPSIVNELGYDFVLIVDTEGLRSPEISNSSSLSHDNELATFIIGIGDITVINIMGENPSEMHEILQICVQAFLRMKKVKIAPSCVFVHQNVAEASAGDKNMEGKRRLLEKLDDMARIAAQEENVDGINSFSDVIQFDLETQVFYFKNLLEGDPPMAPPNPSYSQNVQGLKTKLLTIAEWQKDFQFSSFSKFKSRVSDLWNALLQENFVFSFRNTIEVMVYSALEEKYAAWSWRLRKHALEMQSKLHNQIGSNIIQDVNGADLTEKFDQVYNPLKSEIEKYFKEDKNKETLIKWRASVDKRFESLKHDLIEGTLKKCKELITSKKNRSELDHKKIEYENELVVKSKALASTLKGQRLTDKQVEDKFDTLWVEWIADVAKAQPPEEHINVKAVVETVLREHFKKQPNIIEKIKGEHGKFEFNKKKHISQSTWEWLKSLGRGSVGHDADTLKQQVNQTVNAYIMTKEDENKDFDENLMYEILSCIGKNVDEFQNSTGDLKFTNEFKLDLSIHLCIKSIWRFEKMHKAFRTANNPLTYLQSQRDKYLQTFKNYCKGASSVTIFVDYLCKHIKPEVLKSGTVRTGRRIANELKSNNPAFNSNRSNLENHILKQLVTKKNFSLYEEYIDHPKSYFQRFIHEQVDTFCGDSVQLGKIQEEILEALKNEILLASTAVTEEVDERKGNASMWLDQFCQTVGEHIVINREELKSIEDEEIKDLQFLKNRMAISLEDMVKNEKRIDSVALKQKATEILCEQLQGCWAQCPFCKAICTNTIPNHGGEHSVRFHRSNALGGWHIVNTDNFAIDFCTTLVSSDSSFRGHGMSNWVPYKTYRDAGDPYNTWNITADGSTQHYWKWFICKFQTQWEGKCGYRFAGDGKIPEEWKKITEDSVLKELK